MKRLFVILALAIAGAGPVTTALGASSYAGPRLWGAGEGGGSAFSSHWWHNAFNKERSGFDTTVTFIDNVSYSWRNTVRNRETVTYTVWFSSQVKKGHCRANASGFWGGCWIHG